MDAKIHNLQVGTIIGVNCAIMSQEKYLTFQIVVIKHGGTAIIKTVENFVKSLVINANHLQIYHFYTLPTLTTDYELNN